MQYKKVLALIIPILSAVLLNGQTLQGIVVDANTFEPLPYINIKVKGSMVGTLTNMNGQFELDLSNLQSEYDSIEFSQLSYKSQTLTLSNLRDSIIVRLESASFTLNEVVVSPQPPEEYIKEAIERIPENYATHPYNTKVYFREVVKLNGKYLNQTEAIMNAYNLPATYKGDDSSRLQLIAMRYFEEQEKAVGTVKIKRKQAKQDAIDSTIIASVEAMARDNGPYMVLDSNLERRWHFADEEKVLGNYNFRFKNIQPYEGRKLMHIGYGDKKNEHKDKENGYIYLEENSLAIESYMYQYNNVPASIKAALFVFGYDINEFGIKIISNSQPTDSGYIPEKVILRANADLEKMKLFSANVPIIMEIEAVMIVLNYNIPFTNPCTEGIIIERGKALHEQAESEPNNPIWQQYEGMILPEGSSF